MMRVTTLYASTATATAQYYTLYLTQADGEQPGQWTGRQAGLLGLTGEVTTEQLERLMEGRDPISGPLTTDFQAFELLDIIERFATGFDDLPPLIPGRDDYRILVSTGPLVRIYSAIGQLRPDGAVELIALDLDLGTDCT